jgi:hypothetical protein
VRRTHSVDREHDSDLRAGRPRAAPQRARSGRCAPYAGETAVIAIQTGDVIAGNVPARALRLVQEWSALHRDELRLNGARARENAPLVRIDPAP